MLIMAEIQTTTIVDDLTGKPIDADDVFRIHFTIDGKDYRLDVNRAGADAFEAATGRFVEAATKLTGTTRARASKPRAANSGEQTKMREWARANGYEVAERGRIPAAIQDAYRAAN